MSGSDSGPPGKVSQSDETWRAKLTPEEYRVTREHGTEPPWSGKLLENKDTGKYVCICCETELFSSSAKFDSGTGWPSFFEAVIVSDASGTPSVETRPDTSNGKLRTEVLCRKILNRAGIFRSEFGVEAVFLTCYQSTVSAGNMLRGSSSPLKARKPGGYCAAHLGHVYTDGPQPTGLRYCINSVSLQFKPE